MPGATDDVVIGFGTVLIPQNAQFASLAINGASVEDLSASVKFVVKLGANSLILSLPSPLALTRGADGLFKVHFDGQLGVIYLLEASTDLVHWVPLTPTGVPGQIDFTDTSSAKLRLRFYRVRTQ